MPMRFFDHPRYIEPAIYESAVERVVESTVSDNDILAVYQVGSISTPGISDVDLLVVSADSPGLLTDPLKTLDPDQRYLFTHGLFSISAADVEGLRRFTLFHNYRLRWGQDVMESGKASHDPESDQLRTQVALEYLLSNFIGRTIEVKYNLVSLRKLMLSVHAIRYDLQFLGVTDGPFSELVDQMIAWRQRWFESRVDHDTLARWLARFNRELKVFLDLQLDQNHFSLAGDFPCKLSRHIRLRRTNHLAVNHRGLTSVPFGLSGSHEKKLLNRLNRFTFNIPFQPATNSGFLSERISFFQGSNRKTRSAEQVFAAACHQPPILGITCQ